MKFDLEHNSITVECTGVEVVVYFDGMDVEYCCVDNDFEAELEESISKYVFVEYEDQFISLYDLMIKCDQKYDGIFNETTIEIQEENNNIVFLSNPMMTGTI